jgi:hypothetical protein
MRRVHQLVAMTLIFTLTCMTTRWTTRTARADEPVTAATIAVYATITGGIAGAVWLFDRFLGADDPPSEPPDKRKAYTEKKLKITITEEATTIEAVLRAYSESPAQIRVPEDFPTIVAPPGYTLQENHVLDARDDGVMEVRYDARYGANVLDSSFSGPAVGYNNDSTTVWRYMRPDGAQGSTLTIPISAGNLVASTTDVPGTDGRSSLRFSIEAEELGGVLFESVVEVRQGRMPVVTGDIPVSAFSLTSGRAELSSYHRSLSVPVPDDVNTVTMFVKLEIDGAGSHNRFVRGDVNADAIVDISDRITIFTYLFVSHRALPCREAADVNDSGDIDLSDGIYLLVHLFLSGIAPPIPYPSCGFDSTLDEGFGCLSYPPCRL